MTALALIFAALIALAAVAALGVVTLRSRTGPGPALTGRTVVVHTRKPDDQSVRGIAVAHHADRIVLREAVFLHGSGSVEAGGLIHVPLSAISTVQEIESAEPA